MIALICLFIPSLALVLVREKLYHQHKSAARIFISYILGNMLINGMMVLILYLFFDNHGQLFSKLNRYLNFACKYLALSMILAVAEPFIEKLLRKAFPIMKPHFMRVWEFIKRILNKMYCAIQCALKKCISIAEPICQKVRVRADWQIRTVVFLVIAAALLGVCSYAAQPIWTSWNNYNTTHGFYEEPENTIETIFLGSSVTVNGIIPMELYEDYGICAYNLGTEQQPMLASYYWVEETYRLHSETFSTVVLDVSMLRKTPSEACYHKALDAMKLSEVKIRAVRDYSELFDEETFINLIPLLSYHDRWKEVSEDDFTKSEDDVDVSTRGYHFVTTKRIDSVNSFTSVALPSVLVDEEADELELDTESLYYLKKMIEFCEEHDIQLVLTKAPTTGWSSSAHNAVQKIADEYGLDFLDFNFDPYFSEIDFNYSYDTVDSHMNYYGATKYTNWLGNYLVNECGNHDVRGDDKYAYMETELEEYQRNIAEISLNKITDPCDYISYLLSEGNYTIFISAKDSASSGLKQEQRDYFASIGLTELSELTYRASYLAVIEDGNIVVEMSQRDPGAPQEEETDESFVMNDMEHIEEIYEAEKSGDDEENEEEEVLTLNYNGKLSDGSKYEVISGGLYLGNKSSILINGTEYSGNSRGLNIVVYDNELEEVVDSVTFDTHASSVRSSQDYAERLEEIKTNEISSKDLSGTDLQLYLYDRAAELRKLTKYTVEEAGEDGLLTYLKAFWDEEGCVIFISAKEDAAGSLTDDVRDALEKMGLTELAELETGDAYLAIISEGNVIEEETGDGETQLEISTYDYYMSSGGVDSGNVSSIMINRTEYSKKSTGLNIVVYDAEGETVISQITFDTSTVQQRVE